MRGVREQELHPKSKGRAGLTVMCAVLSPCRRHDERHWCRDLGGWWGRSDVEGLTVGTLRVASTLAEDPVRLITLARLVSLRSYFLGNSRRIAYHKITVAKG